ncbi:transcriptional regulator MntR [Anaerotignum neopropionicum]|uniref:Transcriptional regulator MntR n=1 Tax=Anaerotignum neopropionicum TaxID=36847 RepID=A0A136WC09_9FIRM|nr:metal-dependent transcriptional regulator [Anaerotignum neopropionicum]KXL52030.1 transcriptional regulator MntR [Anaerotignum neopropionicum]
MKVQESMEDYLETILLLEKQTGYVRSIDIATALGFSKPSISNAMKKLKSNGYIDMEDRGSIKLTEKGKSVAMGTYERHCVISQILMGFGVSKETALEDACRIEHVISNETFEGMKEFLKSNPSNSSK